MNVYDYIKQSDGSTKEVLIATLPDPVPAVVSPLQMRRALRQMGLKAGVDALLATKGEEENEAWEFALEIPRNNPLIIGAASALGIDETGVDDLFRLAASL